MPARLSDSNRVLIAPSPRNFLRQRACARHVKTSARESLAMRFARFLIRRASATRQKRIAVQNCFHGYKNDTTRCNVTRHAVVFAMKAKTENIQRSFFDAMKTHVVSVFSRKQKLRSVLIRSRMQMSVMQGARFVGTQQHAVHSAFEFTLP